jgi:hypothetical protein
MHKHSEFFKLIHECQKQNIDLSVLLEPSIAAFRRLVSDAARDMSYAGIEWWNDTNPVLDVSTGAFNFEYEGYTKRVDINDVFAPGVIFLTENYARSLLELMANNPMKALIDNVRR